jgi:hypothetical protein
MKMAERVETTGHTDIDRTIHSQDISLVLGYVGGAANAPGNYSTRPNRNAIEKPLFAAIGYYRRATLRTPDRSKLRRVP